MQNSTMIKFCRECPVIEDNSPAWWLYLQDGPEVQRQSRAVAVTELRRQMQQRFPDAVAGEGG